MSAGMVRSTRQSASHWILLVVAISTFCWKVADAFTSAIRREDPAKVKDMAVLRNLIILFSAQCNHYQDWQTVVLIDSWKHAGAPGRLIRTLACSKADLVVYKRLTAFSDDLDTFVHDDRSVRVNGEPYTPLNKPYGIMKWLSDGPGRDVPDDTIILLLDPDMMFRTQANRDNIIPMIENLSSQNSAAIGEDYRYVLRGMERTQWKLPLSLGFTAHELPKLQSIGLPCLLKKSKLQQLAPRWYNLTVSIVADQELLSLVQDANNNAPWIAEMYGYNLAAVGLSHMTQADWPHVHAPQPPWIDPWSKRVEALFIHYTHPFSLCGRPFSKSSFYDVDLLACELDKDYMEKLRPPNKTQAMLDSCKLCIGDGDINGWSSQCLDPAGKALSWETWFRVYTSIFKWHQRQCVRKSAMDWVKASLFRLGSNIPVPKSRR